MSRLASLPDEVLKLVMQHVPVKERLTSCCLINSRLHAAAVAATQQLGLGGYFTIPAVNDVRVTSPEGARSALNWLDHQGEHLTSLRVGSFDETLRQLPCPNLLQLYMGQGCSVQLGPAADGSPGVIQACSKLTKLELSSCDVMDAPGEAVVDGLSSLVHLNWWPTGQWTLSAATLPCMHHLTFLQFCNPSVENLQQLGGLTDLQDLCVWAQDDDVVLGPSSIPWFTFPARLTRLELKFLVEVEVLSLVPTTLKHFALGCSIVGPLGAEGLGSSLSGIARLQHLTTLFVRIEPEGLLDSVWPPPCRAYSALTASSNLVEFSLECADLPEGIWPFVFPAGHKLPHLTSLMIEELVRDPAPALWGAADIASLVSCCPNLCTLDTMYLQRGPHVAQLQQLTALTRAVVVFVMDGEVAAFEQSVKGLAAVTQLRCLHLYKYNHSVSVGSLLPLTSLTALTELRFHDDDNNVFVQLTQKKTSVEVWLQLLERCAADPNCQPTALRTLAQQLAEQRALTGQQQQQLAAQQQQSAMQQRQLSAQQEVVAEQGAQIAGLQGQLQAMQAQLQELRQRQQQ